MATIKTGSRKLDRITRQLAEEWANLPRCAIDRPIDPARVEHLLNRIKEGLFHTALWVRCWVKELQQYIRMNGGHSPLAFLQALDEGVVMYGRKDGGLEPSVLIEEYEVDTLKEAAVLFWQYDSMKSTRKQTDCNRAFQAVAQGIEHLSRNNRDGIISALSYAKWGEAYSRYDRTGEEKAGLILGNESFALWVNDIINTVDGRICNRTPVIAAMKRTWDHDKKEAQAFWQCVIDGDNPRPKSPERRLNLLLHKYNSRGADGIRSNRQMKRRDLFVTCLKAYNNWVTGSEKDIVKGTKDHEPTLVSRHGKAS